MKILTTLLLLLSIGFSAQNQRFIYEYTFVKDSLQKDKTKSENLYLDISKNGSKFYSYQMFKMDSTMQAQIEKQVKGSMGTSSVTTFSTFSDGASVTTVVEKEYPTFAISQYETIGSDPYRLKDDRKITWKISPETMRIGEFMAQKATTEMYGRKWIAWFSTDLPFQDGPYKFHGLPGLIVKIEDATKSHIIELKAVQKLPKDYEMQSVANKKRYNTLITLDYPKFKKVFAENRLDPLKSYKQMLSRYSGKMISMTDDKGNEIDMKKDLKNMEESAIEAYKKDNNILELDLLK